MTAVDDRLNKGLLLYYYHCHYYYYYYYYTVVPASLVRVTLE
jgi:hypothetical protein